MDYFDDIEFLDVKTVESTGSSAAHAISDYYCIGIILGEGFVRMHSVNGSKLLKMPFMYFGGPGDCGGWQSVGGRKRENRWFIIRGARAQRMVQSLLQYTNENRIIRLNSYHDLILAHQKMLRIFRNGLPSQSYQLAVCAEEFMGHVYRQLETRHQTLPVFQFVENVIRQIVEQPFSTFDFRKTAREGHVSYDYFRICFRKTTGMRMRDFILKKRMEYAVVLLQETTKSIKEISSLCQFSRQAEFARFIKSQTGLTPKNIRSKPVWDR